MKKQKFDKLQKTLLKLEVGKFSVGPFLYRIIYAGVSFESSFFSRDVEAEAVLFLWKRKRKNLPLPLPHRLFDLKSN